MIKVLQLGNDDWSKRYKIPTDYHWHFNDFPEKKSEAEKAKAKTKKKKRKGYDVVLVTDGATLDTAYWNKLTWMVDPYHVIYMPGVEETLNQAGKEFLKCSAAEKMMEDPQVVIDHLENRYFFGQSGVRMFPTNIFLNESKVSEYEVLDSCNLKVKVNTHDQWVNIGSYRNSLYIDPKRLIKLWLTYRQHNVQVRLRIFIQPAGTDGDPDDNHVLTIDSNSDKELYLPIEPSDQARFACVTIEVKGDGDLTIGLLHSRWGREGRGEFIAGGKRIVNMEKREDIPYFFSPGDLKPPLTVYFSGARISAGFEAFPLFRKLKTPTLLFTDVRLSLGQFYADDDDFMGKAIIKVIEDTLRKLGFTKRQLIMNGTSMGSYASLLYGGKIGAYIINVTKPLANLGYIASRGRLQRPDDFEAIYDIDNQLVPSLDSKHLHELDERFWKKFDKLDLSNSRLFVGYMKNDDFDNKAMGRLIKSPAVKNSMQFTYKGFPGRHNDNRTIILWFIDRLNQMLESDFGRKY